MSETIAWPPAYVVKKHPRAKYVKIRTSIRYGLEVVTPLRFSAKHIPDIIESNRHWIEEQLKKLSLTEDKTILPNEILLHFLDAKITIHYLKGKHKRIRLIIRPGNEWILFGDIENIISCKNKLREKLKELAEEHLKTALNLQALKMHLNYKNLTIRAQQARWGSCSADKIICLNYHLLFLPKELGMHVIIHELAHLVHLDHSENFWKLVSEYDNDWKENRKLLKQFERWIPSWILR